MPRVRITIAASGNREVGSEVTMRWGHPDFHDHEYFRAFTVAAPDVKVREFDLLDRLSEFEVQTEGGDATGYNIRIEFDNVLVLESKHNAPPDFDKRTTAKGGVGVQRSSGPNTYGEQTIRLDLNGNTQGSV